VGFHWQPYLVDHQGKNILILREKCFVFFSWFGWFQYSVAEKQKLN